MAASNPISGLPQITREFVREHADENLVTIHNLVFDLTFFFRHHPGGEDILQEYVGLDATDAFESVGHSEHARTMMLKFVVGCIVPSQHIKHSSGSPFIVEEMKCPMRQIVA
uniref:Cytochrome b5 heme-binding domain-containing protein n=1 Tax=Panagrellus redivivus TaxID=6233 RepID=A0A7E4ZWN2_PANRE